jgi:uncharacterized protein (TIRG00374 family)
LVIAVGIIYWLATSGKLNFSALQNLISWQLGPLVLLIAFLNLFFASERWRYLLRTQQISAGSWPTFKLSMIGVFFNFAMPGGVGGDVVKAYYFSKDYPDTKVIAVTSVLMDRVLGLYAMIMMALFVMFYDLKHVVTIPALHSLFYVVMMLFFLCSFGLAIIFSKKIYEKGWLKALLFKLPLSSKTLKLYDSIYIYGNSGKAIFVAILISLAAQVCSVLFLSLAGVAAGIDVPLKTYFLVAPLGFMATAIPISPAGVGVGQAAFYFLFNLYTGTETELGPTVITAMQVVQLLLSLIGAFYYLKRKDRSYSMEKVQ